MGNTSPVVLLNRKDGNWIGNVSRLLISRSYCWASVSRAGSLEFVLQNSESRKQIKSHSHSSIGRSSYTVMSGTALLRRKAEPIDLSSRKTETKLKFSVAYAFEAPTMLGLECHFLLLRLHRSTFEAKTTEIKSPFSPFIYYKLVQPCLRRPWSNDFNKCPFNAAKAKTKLEISHFRIGSSFNLLDGPASWDRFSLNAKFTCQ